MNGAGLDISTKFLDFVILNTEHPSECEHRRVQLATEDGKWWESARGMGSVIWWPDDGFKEPTIPGWFRSHGVELLGIERPYGPSRGSIASLHTILGAVLATIPQHITVLEVRPAEMRQALGLKGNVSKETMVEAVCFRACRCEIRAGECDICGKWPPDALDAWAVAWAAYRMCEKAAAGCRHDEHRKGGEPNQ